MLLASLIALLSGPLLYLLLEKKPKYLSFIDGFAFVAISGLIILHQISDAENFNLLSLILLALGFLGPNIIEGYLSKREREVHLIALAVALIGLLFHAVADGASLLTGHGHSEEFLPLAVVLHRIPDGICIWWLIRPHLGKIGSWLVIALMVLATLLGYFSIGTSLEGAAVNYFQAFVAGSILHVVFFRLHVHHQHDSICCEHSPVKSHKLEIFGNLFAIALLWDLFLEHGQENVKIFQVFASLFNQSALALLIGYFGSVLVYRYIPKSSVDWLKKGSRFQQALKGMLIGLPLPICSCGVLPFYITLLNKGVPITAAIAFLIATPELGLDSIFISIPLLGIEIAALRLLAAIFLAVIVAMIVGTKKRSLVVLEDNMEEKPVTFTEALHYGLKDLVDRTAPWVIIGLFVAALFESALGEYKFQLPYMLDVLVLGVVGSLLYVCASGATPLAAVFLAKGFSPGAVIAFLLLGPATNVSTFAVLGKAHSKKFAFKFAITVILITFILGVIINFISPALPEPVSHHQHAEQNSIAGYLVLILFAYSWLRQGARNFMSAAFKQSH